MTLTWRYHQCAHVLSAEDNGGVSFENGMKVIHAILPDGTAVKGPWPSHSDNDRPCLIMLLRSTELLLCQTPTLVLI